MPTNSIRNIRLWLLICSILVLCMIIVGGYTRLTDSGLSIVEWKPVTGVVYPFNQSMWEQEFSKYQESPEYKFKNFSFTLQEFRQIYFVEYAHRLLGRILGIVFILPFFYFLIKKHLTKNLIKKLMVIFVLGAAQGTIGWYMVKSGLSNLPEVSQYRLALHLLMALLIYGLLIWNFFSLSKSKLFIMPHKNLLYIPIALLALVVLQIFSGALVAGLNAGLIYNTYPLMDGQAMPVGLSIIEPWYLNFFENVTMVQFVHRTLGVIIFFCTILLSPIMLARVFDRKLKLAWVYLLLVVFMQFTLGVLTLLNAVPLSLGLLHQLGAIILFTNLLFVVNLLICQK